jgi:hypothetical protein
VSHLDQRKHDFDVLEHVFGGVQTATDDDEPPVIIHRHELSRSEHEALDIRVTMSPEGERKF